MARILIVTKKMMMMHSVCLKKVIYAVDNVMCKEMKLDIDDENMKKN